MSATIRPATMKGPAIFLAQFIGDAPPFDSFDAICGWAAGLGYKGIQAPTSDPCLIDIDEAAASQAYCDEIAGVAASHGLVITELSTHLQGQLVAVHPAYNEAFDAFAPLAVRGRPNERVDQMMKDAQASRRLGLTGSVSFTGGGTCPWRSKDGLRRPTLLASGLTFGDLYRAGTVGGAMAQRCRGPRPAGIAAAFADHGNRIKFGRTFHRKVILVRSQAISRLLAMATRWV